MAEKKQLGVFWDRNKLYFVKTLANHPSQLFSIPFDPKDLEFKVKDGVSSDNLPINTLIKNTLKHEKIETPILINLALPIKDIIFRSFVIPWMLPNEVRGVVEFEASRYVPFSLEDLSFSFHPTTVMEDGTRRIRIVFVAIKKDTLHTYTTILEKTRLTLDVVEPAPLSLIRVLTIKGLIDPKKTIALIEKNETSGKIIILDKGIPQFVREFQLAPPSPHETAPVLLSPEMAFNRLINEVRVCIDYFNRQDTSLQVCELCLLSSDTTEEQIASLAEDMDMPVTPIDISSVLEHSDYNDSAFLNSFGSALIETKDNPAIFNLSTSNVRTDGITMPSWKDLALYKSIVITLFCCALLTTGFWGISNKMNTQYDQQIKSLKEKMGVYSGAPVTTLQTQHDDRIKKIDQFKKIFVKSDITYFLVKLSTLLPEGAWLKLFSVSYDNDANNIMQPQINIDGYVYCDDTKEQFRRINTLLKSIKDDERLKNTFQDINLSSIKSEKINGYDITYFKINFNQL